MINVYYGTQQRAENQQQWLKTKRKERKRL